MSGALIGGARRERSAAVPGSLVPISTDIDYLSDDAVSSGTRPPMAEEGGAGPSCKMHSHSRQYQN